MVHLKSKGENLLWKVLILVLFQIKKTI